MRKSATLKNFSTSEGKQIISRNLSRIKDIVILDMDIKNSTITFLYASKIALARVESELKCLGFPISSLKDQNKKDISDNNRLLKS
ncbi:hypothetical protein [Aurantibacter sp.]|uniref:hypothetical protein n=1 Tax=Aurantibacter sp. TaxID=2807103 RepID=UPI0032656CBE